jgi:hypothetical protein
MQAYLRWVIAGLMTLLPALTLRAEQPGSSLADAKVPSATLPSPAGTTILFTADPQVSDTLWEPLYAAIRLGIKEHAEEFRQLGITSQPHLLRRSEIALGAEFPLLLQVRLEGRCDIPVQAPHFMRAKGPLGWVFLVNGKIQPFIFVDCTRLAQVLNPLTLGENAARRQRLMNIAIANVVLHEWIHIASQSSRHSRHGLMQEQLSNRELTAAVASPP